MTDFTIENEPWNVYRLSDGTEVRVRVVLVAASRREGKFAEDGSPMYDLNMQQIVHVTAPEHLRRVQAPSTTTRN